MCLPLVLGFADDEGASKHSYGLSGTLYFWIGQTASWSGMVGNSFPSSEFTRGYEPEFCFSLNKEKNLFQLM